MKDVFLRRALYNYIFVINKVYSPNSCQIACFTLLKSLCTHLQRFKEKRRTVLIKMARQAKAPAAKPECSPHGWKGELTLHLRSCG